MKCMTDFLKERMHRQESTPIKSKHIGEQRDAPPRKTRIFTKSLGADYDQDFSPRSSRWPQRMENLTAWKGVFDRATHSEVKPDRKKPQQQQPHQQQKQSGEWSQQGAKRRNFRPSIASVSNGSGLPRCGRGLDPDRVVQSGLLPGQQGYPPGSETGSNRTAGPLYSRHNFGSNYVFEFRSYHDMVNM